MIKMLRNLLYLALMLLGAWLASVLLVEKPRPENVIVIRSLDPCGETSPKGNPLLRWYHYKNGFECHYEQ